MPFFQDLNQLQQTEWDRGTLWDLMFDPPPPSPFNSWFPVLSVREGRFDHTPHQFTPFYRTIAVPGSAGLNKLVITYIDDVNSTLLNWLDDWVNNTIFGGGRYTATLEASCKNLSIQKLNGNRDVVDERRLLVFPEGSLAFQGENRSDPQIYHISFTIAGKVG